MAAWPSHRQPLCRPEDGICMAANEQRAWRTAEETSRSLSLSLSLSLNSVRSLSTSLANKKRNVSPCANFSPMDCSISFPSFLPCHLICGSPQRLRFISLCCSRRRGVSCRVVSCRTALRASAIGIGDIGVAPPILPIPPNFLRSTRRAPRRSKLKALEETRTFHAHVAATCATRFASSARLCIPICAPAPPAALLFSYRPWW